MLQPRRAQSNVKITSCQIYVSLPFSSFCWKLWLLSFSCQRSKKRRRQLQCRRDIHFPKKVKIQQRSPIRIYKKNWPICLSVSLFKFDISLPTSCSPQFAWHYHPMFFRHLSAHIFPAIFGREMFIRRWKGWCRKHTVRVLLTKGWNAGLDVIINTATLIHSCKNGRYGFSVEYW